jgi:tetratricopeptide (TPR) repeat protein
MIIAMIKPIVFACSKSTCFRVPCQTRAVRLVTLLTVALLTTTLFAGTLGASELFDRGADALLYNRPREAATIFEQVISAEPVNTRAYLYLALSYEQLDMYERAITTLQRAEDVPGADRGTIRFNIGNNYLHLGDAERAHAAFTAAIDANPVGVDAHLNRANIGVSLERYDDAIADYTRVLGLEPEHPQRPQIERMIALLEDHVEQARLAAEEEERRLAEEERRRAEEEARRLAEEERQRAEAEARRRALLDNVLDSIRTSSEQTENMSAGSAEIDTYDDDEFDIAD